MVRPSRALPHRTSRAGTTLIEALAVVAIIATLIAINAPGIVRLVSSSRVSTATNDLVHAIASARSEAIARNRRVYLAPTASRWRDGWALFIDRNNNRAYDGPTSAMPDDVIAIHDALPRSVDIVKPTGVGEPFTDRGAPPRAYILFDGTGYPRQHNGAMSFGSLLVVDRTGGLATTRVICIASYGRVRVVAEAITC